MTNNRAEAYNLLLGTRLLNRNVFKKPIIIGDFAIIIVTLDANRDFRSIAINKIYQRIRESGKYKLKACPEKPKQGRE